MMFLALLSLAHGESAVAAAFHPAAASLPRVSAPGVAPIAPVQPNLAKMDLAAKLDALAIGDAAQHAQEHPVYGWFRANPLSGAMISIGSFCAMVLSGAAFAKMRVSSRGVGTELATALTDAEAGVVRRAPAPAMSMEADTSRREFLAKLAGTGAMLATAANAEVDYAGVGFLGGAKQIDVNNANVRVYQKLPGVYPNAAGKIVSKAPYKSKEDMYSKANFSSAEAAAVKRHDANFIFLEPRPEYIIDNINNGLYR